MPTETNIDPENHRFVERCLSLRLSGGARGLPLFLRLPIKPPDITEPFSFHLNHQPLSPPLRPASCLKTLSRYIARADGRWALGFSTTKTSLPSSKAGGHTHSDRLLFKAPRLGFRKTSFFKPTLRRRRTLTDQTYVPDLVPDRFPTHRPTGPRTVDSKTCAPHMAPDMAPFSQAPMASSGGAGSAWARRQDGLRTSAE